MFAMEAGTDPIGGWLEIEIVDNMGSYHSILGKSDLSATLGRLFNLIKRRQLEIPTVIPRTPTPQYSIAHRRAEGPISEETHGSPAPLREFIGSGPPHRIVRKGETTSAARINALHGRSTGHVHRCAALAIGESV
jgi:hypothetical protein